MALPPSEFATLERALLSGISEVAERDAIAILLAAKLPLPRIIVYSEPESVAPYLSHLSRRYEAQISPRTLRRAGLKKSDRDGSAQAMSTRPEIRIELKKEAIVHRRIECLSNRRGFAIHGRRMQSGSQ